MLKVSPIVEKAALLPVTLIMEDAPENVRLVVVVISIAGSIEKLSVEVPKLIERTLLLLLCKLLKLQVTLFVLNEPLVNVTIPAVSASCKIHPPPIPSKVKLPKLLPAVVIVLPILVALKLIFNELEVIPVTSFKDPYTFSVLLLPLIVGVLVTPVQSMLLQAGVVTSNVMVCPTALNEFESKYTLSVDCGTWV
jgi:hypothetical protein